MAEYKHIVSPSVCSLVPQLSTNSLITSMFVCLSVCQQHCGKNSTDFLESWWKGVARAKEGADPDSTHKRAVFGLGGGLRSPNALLVLCASSLLTAAVAEFYASARIIYIR